MTIDYRLAEEAGSRGEAMSAQLEEVVQTHAVDSIWTEHQAKRAEFEAVWDGIERRQRARLAADHAYWIAERVRRAAVTARREGRI